MLPVEKIGDFLAHEKEIYLASEVKRPEPSPVIADTAAADGTAGQTTKVIWEDQWKTHKVKKGETLKSVSTKYGVTSSDIKKWNKLKSSTLKIGQNLKVKVKVKKTITIPKVTEPADTTSTVTPKVTPPAADPKPTPKPAAPKEEYVYYTVKSGDSLSSIAAKNKVSVDSIVKLNKGLVPNKIQIGQKIKIKKK
jgi:membrane-bound lytic murein transglycosylase D